MFGTRLDVRRLEDRIEKYEALPVVTGKILFYGHSLFTRCSAITNFTANPKLELEVLGKDGEQAIVNHGFGTSCAEELLYYYDRLVRPYKPRALVLATMSNDVSLGYSAKEVMEIEARIIDWARADFPGIPVYCFSDEPTLKHKGEVSVYTRVRDEYNQLLKAYCAEKPGCIYVPMQEQAFFFTNPEDRGDYDKVRDDIYEDDQVHLNPQGYAMFMEFVKELLADVL